MSMPMRDTMDQSIAERFDRLERDCRRWKRMSGLTLLGCLLLGLGGAYRGEAEQLILRGRNGDQRVVIGTRPNGTAYVSLYDRDGNHRVDLGTNQNNASYLLMYDRDGKRRIDLGVDQANATYQHAYDRDGRKLFEQGSEDH